MYSIDFIIKFFKFGLVGLSGFVIDFGITWFCREKIHLNTYLANAIGFICAATTNYILNRIWTFQSSNEQIAMEYLSFLGICCVGLGINSLVIYLIHSRLNANFYISKIIATAIVTIWNFIANYYFTFQ